MLKNSYFVTNNPQGINVHRRYSAFFLLLVLQTMQTRAYVLPTGYELAHSWFTYVVTLSSYLPKEPAYYDSLFNKYEKKKLSTQLQEQLSTAQSANKVARVLKKITIASFAGYLASLIVYKQLAGDTWYSMRYPASCTAYIIEQAGLWLKRIGSLSSFFYFVFDGAKNHFLIKTIDEELDVVSQQP